jgi:hypothetical protein
MTKKALAFSLLLMAAVLAAAFWTFAQDDLTRIDSGAFTSKQRPPVPFAHDKHNEAAGLSESCNLCHHVYRDGKRVQDEDSIGQACADCHALKNKGRVPGLMRAYHGLCTPCHRERKAGPITCGACHPKRS